MPNAEEFLVLPVQNRWDGRHSVDGRPFQGLCRGIDIRMIDEDEHWSDSSALLRVFVALKQCGRGAARRLHPARVSGSIEPFDDELRSFCIPTCVACFSAKLGKTRVTLTIR